MKAFVDHKITLELTKQEAQIISEALHGLWNAAFFFTVATDAEKDVVLSTAQTLHNALKG